MTAKTTKPHKTIEQLADEAVKFHRGRPDAQTVANLYSIITSVVRADREQRSDMEKFGEFVYELMDGEEWSSDTLQAIGDYATFTLKRPFSEPEAAL